MLAIKRHGHPDLASVRAIGPPGLVRRVATAINERADVLAVWALRTGEVLAPLRTADGRLGRLQRVGRTEPFPRLSVGLDDARRAFVAWSGQAATEGFPHGPFVANLALAPAGGKFAPATRLEAVPPTSATYVFGPGVKAAWLPDGRVAVAWTGRDGECFVVRSAVAEHGRVGPPQTVSAAGDDAVLADLATDPPGTTLVAWVTGLNGSFPPSGRFASKLPSAPRTHRRSRGQKPSQTPGADPEKVRAAFTAIGDAPMAFWAGTFLGQPVGIARRPPI
jgi:hypothetical protein